MEDFERYLHEIVEPTIEDFAEHPTSVRHGFLACVATYHSLDYLAFDRATGRTPKGTVGNLRETFGQMSEDFRLVDDVAHAFKHVVANRRNPNLRSNEITRQSGAFSSGFSSGFDVGAVTVSGRPEVNLLSTVRRAEKFLRERVRDSK
jgi:hypothetical protein